MVAAGWNGEAVTPIGRTVVALLAVQRHSRLVAALASLVKGRDMLMKKATKGSNVFLTNNDKTTTLSGGDGMMICCANNTTMTKRARRTHAGRTRADLLTHFVLTKTTQQKGEEGLYEYCTVRLALY